MNAIFSYCSIGDNDRFIEQFVTILVPHIESHWKIVGDYLNCDPKIIQEFHHVISETNQCCREMLNLCLRNCSSGNQVCMSVIATIKQVKGLEDIDKIEELSALIVYVYNCIYL